jgi:hypothetical protein
LILTTARSTQIAQSLGIQNAERSSRCTVCHSPLATVAQSRLVPPEQHAQGVACESCHGPAESWLRSHTRRDYTYAMRVGSGMRDLRNIYVRAMPALHVIKFWRIKSPPQAIPLCFLS